jgi:hypothetical protein
MCTVTFIAQRTGYCLGMNRDEKLTRRTGLPPRKIQLNGHVVLCPSEPGGGTWIALNDNGASLALINWYSVTRRVQPNPISRGEVVRMLCGADLPAIADAGLQSLPLARINPFRLIGVFRASMEIVEWRWDLKRLLRTKLPWKTQQWVSSGFDEPTAQRVRGRTFRRALGERPAKGLVWLRKLHGSHSPQCGPFSTCMHRADAATASYTEVTVSNRGARMSYHSGPLCLNTGTLSVTRPQ